MFVYSFVGSYSLAHLFMFIVKLLISASIVMSIILVGACSWSGNGFLEEGESDDKKDQDSAVKGDADLDLDLNY